MRYISLLILAMLSQSALAFNPAKSLNSAFCLNVGIHTQTAMAQSQQLQEILKFDTPTSRECSPQTPVYIALLSRKQKALFQN